MIEMFGAWRAMRAKQAKDAAEDARAEAALAKARAEGFLEPAHAFVPLSIGGHYHRNNTPWYKAPIPTRWHRCSAWSTYPDRAVERCACGALRFTSGPGSGLWGERNQTRRFAQRFKRGWGGGFGS